MDKENEDLDVKQEETQVKQESEREVPKRERFDRLMFGPRTRRDENRAPLKIQKQTIQMKLILIN